MKPLGDAKPWETAEAKERGRATGEAAGPHVLADRADQLHHAIVPTNPAGLDHLAGRISLTVAEAAPALGVSVRTLQMAIRDGDIPSLKLKGRRLIPLRALERHLEALAYAESGALDAWELALSRATATRLGRARREAYNARRELRRRAKEARRLAADLKDSPASASRDLAVKVVADLASAYTKLTVEEQLASKVGRDLIGDIDALRREFGLTEKDALDERPVL